MTRNLIKHISIVALTALVGFGSISAALAQASAKNLAAPAENAAKPPVPTENQKKDGTKTNAAKAANAIRATIQSQTLHAPENLSVGQPFQLEIVVEHPPGTLVDMPDTLKKTRWDLIDSNQSEVATESAITTTLSLNFAVFRPGQAHLPAFDLRVLAPDGTHKNLQTEKVAILVRSTIEPGETPPFAPPRDPVAIWTTDYTAAWVGGFLLGSTLLAALVVFAMRRRKLTDEIKPIRAAHEIALEKLRTLENSTLLDQGDVMMYYVRMSEAIREYLGRRFDFPGTELTTAEINAELARLKSRWPRGIALEDVKRWLEHCDFVKFSGAAPSTEAARNSLERAFGIVELTRRKSEIVIPQDDPTPEATPNNTTTQNEEKPSHVPLQAQQQAQQEDEEHDEKIITENDNKNDHKNALQKTAITSHASESAEHPQPPQNIDSTEEEND